MLFRTNPSNWKDAVLWPILRVLFEPFSRKQSHWWHWRKIDPGAWPRNSIRPILNIPPGELDLTARERTGPWSRFWQTNFGWRKVVIVRPGDWDWTTWNEQKHSQPYQVGFFLPGHGHGYICSVVIKGTPCALLLGPRPVDFFAIYPDIPYRQVHLRIAGFSTKDQLAIDIPLL